MKKEIPAINTLPSLPAPCGVKTPNRFRPGTVALKKIKKSRAFQVDYGRADTEQGDCVGVVGFDDSSGLEA